MENVHRMYVTELRRRLPAHYFQPVPSRALWMLPYLAVAVAGTLIIALVDLPLPARIGVGILIGLAYGSLGFLGHEILHGGVVRTAWLRDFLGGICMLPAAIAPLLWRQWHNVDHHGHTQILGEDPDAASTLEQYHKRSDLRLLYRLVPVKSILFFALLSVWLSVHALIVLRHKLPILRGRARALLIAETLAAAGFWIVLGVLVGWRHFPFFYVIPALVGNFVVMAYIATNHMLNPLLEEDDPLMGSLTVTVPRLLDVIHSNFSHHTEHHIFPAMSARYVPHVKRLLKELWPDRYHEMPLRLALGALWRTPRLYLDNVRLVDPSSGATYGVLGHGLDPKRVAPLSEG
jgi:fatty acid desaturase